ncbi:6855_t:CDS:1, partial [Dentiscutata heterogama]
KPVLLYDLASDQTNKFTTKISNTNKDTNPHLATATTTPSTDM